MPVILLERIPLPSLRTYTSISVLLLSCSVFYAYQCVQTFQPADLAKEPTYNVPSGSDNVDLSEKLEQNYKVVNPDPDVLKEPLSDEFELELPYESFWWNVFYVLTSEIWCVWVGQHQLFI
jgi:autocrine motility factor receptor